MISRALAALALGGLLFIILPGCFQTGEASQAQTISPEIIERYQQTLPMDIGINTGPIVSGNIDLSTKMEYTVIGDEVNIAASMQGIAQPGVPDFGGHLPNRCRNSPCNTTRTDYIQRKKTTVGVYRVDGLRDNE